MTISAALQRIYSVAPTGAYYMEAITMRHSSLTQDLHMTNNEFGFSGGISAPGGVPVDFVAIPFVLKMPPKDTSGSQQLQIVFSNVEQDLINDIERMARRPYEPVIFRYRVYINGVVGAAGHHTEQLTPAWRMEVSGFQVTENTIVAVAAKMNSHNKPFPKLIYTPDNFPGIT
jgi:hypothetical protein